MAIVDTVLLVMTMLNIDRRGLIVGLAASMILLLAACGSEAPEQAQEVAVAPTSIPTTAPLSVPTVTPVPAPTATALPAPTPTPLPAPTAAPTTPATPTLEPAASPTSSADASPASTAAPTATVAAEVIETPTPAPTPTVEEPEATSTPAAETPTAVVVSSGEPPLECYDRTAQVYRGFVDGVDALSMEAGRVYCAGAGTNGVSAAGSYRHSSGLIVSRNADYRFKDDGSGYIPYSGSMHFCVSGQPTSAPFVADTVPALLVLIDSEAARHLAQGAVGPTAFTGNGSQC